MIRELFVATLLAALASAAFADSDWSQEQQCVLDTIDRLSESTAPEGAGADEYASNLADDFSRWTLGGKEINDKASWVEGVRGWFDQGWRVVDRDQKVIEIIVDGDRAYSRRIVSESYRGPEGDGSESRAALAEVWIRRGDRWLLSMVNVSLLDSP